MTFSLPMADIISLWVKLARLDYFSAAFCLDESALPASFHQPTSQVASFLTHFPHECYKDVLELQLVEKMKLDEESSQKTVSRGFIEMALRKAIADEFGLSLTETTDEFIDSEIKKREAMGLMNPKKSIKVFEERIQKLIEENQANQAA